MASRLRLLSALIAVLIVLIGATLIYTNGIAHPALDNVGPGAFPVIIAVNTALLKFGRRSAVDLQACLLPMLATTGVESVSLMIGAVHATTFHGAVVPVVLAGVLVAIWVYAVRLTRQLRHQTIHPAGMEPVGVTSDENGRKGKPVNS